MPEELFIGLMSGTSLDGIDAALVEFENNKILLRAFEYFPYSQALIKDIQALSQPNHSILLKHYGSIDTQLGHLYAHACLALLETTNIADTEIKAIGCHGQTVFHAPDSSFAFSLQIGDPNIIAEKTGITTIADFRRRDIAAGGQGAPLVPAFHQAMFSHFFDLCNQNICIVNIGGVANITGLSSEKTLGFDVGPGNALIDYWTQKHLKKPYDKNGSWANSGTINTKLLNILKDDPYFKLVPPKSTGKEYFSSNWLDKQLAPFPDIKRADIQATLCEFTAKTICEAIQHYIPQCKQTLICGGGAHNSYLVNRIKRHSSHPVSTTAVCGIDPDHVEAMAFAWLARQTLNNLPGNLLKVTGANSPVILGGIYPGKNGLH